MAESLSITELRSRLQSSETGLRDPFILLKAISRLLSIEGEEPVAREMVLRALERRNEFGSASPVLDSMARAVGLYPYTEVESLSLREHIAYEYNRPFNMTDNIVFHREQAEIYRRLLAGDSIILSAPTSFGKSRIIDAMIASGKYENIAIIVPTLALIDETRRRLSTFSPRFKIITHISQKPTTRNVFILTAERAVAYENLPRIDFFAIDEFYKIGAMDEDESRTVALNEAFYRLAKSGGQFYLLGPNINRIPVGLEKAFRCYFFPTQFSTVVVETIRVPNRERTIERLLSLTRNLQDPTLIFCSSPSRVNEVARAMLNAGIGIDGSPLQDAADWIAKTYHPEWIFGTGLLRGIGIHHGRLPRSLSQYVVRAFNEDKLRFLICTSTLIEGVNTKAKNVIIWDNTIAKRPLDFFTFNNIKGRSGRMFQHFIGRVFLFEDPPQEELPFVDFPLFTQDNSTPTTLLIQLEQEDLSDKSKERIKKYSDEEVLSINTLRANRSVDPDAQIELALHIQSNASTIWPKLAWRGFPQKYDQLKFLCELIWHYLVDSKRRQGVFSGSQLALKTWQLYQTANISKRVLAELRPSKWAAKSPDEAVERVLQFERNWAGFELPKLLVAVSRIQQEILARRDLPTGDYSAFAAQVESLFRNPVLSALDEYGIPLPVAEKLQAYLQTKDDLDVGLSNLKRLNIERLKLLAFERELVKDSQQSL